MGVIKVQHALQSASGLPTDRYINSFYFAQAELTTPEDLSSMTSAIQSFYTGVPTGQSSALKSLFSVRAGGAFATMKFYDMDQPMPRAPIHENSYDFNLGTNGKGLPSEVAICLSYEAPQISGQIQRRRRGRIYLGPLNDTCMNVASPTEPARPTPGARQLILDAARDLWALAQGQGWNWNVHSTVGGSSATISRFWVDDAFDIQRRRGEAPTSRLEEVVGNP